MVQTISSNSGLQTDYNTNQWVMSHIALYIQPMRSKYFQLNIQKYFIFIAYFVFFVCVLVRRSQALIKIFTLEPVS